MSGSGGVVYYNEKLKDLLADKPIEGADAIRSLANWSKGGEVNGERGKKAMHHTVWDGEAEKVVF
ncbi:hypothetical protein B0H10DRAFT_2042852 [Mycena sp. CBHHK59/15]|nr:hypothetical protein B0H10DRAFT_2042852 [Mycena sp. CBHHK59/15]